VVVGADGAWSRVRPLVSAAAPAFTGVSFVEGGLDEVDTAHPALARLVGRGKVFALGERQALIAQRNANAHVRVYAALNVSPAGRTDAGLDARSPATLRASVLARFAGWAPQLRALVEHCPDPLVLRPLVALPVGHAWPNRPGLTLLGDAAHVMSPFSGEGVNNALWDALALADELGAGGDWRTAAPRYETAMFARAEVSATGAAQGLESVMGADALADALAHFRAHAAAQPTPSATPAEIG
jgi:2-polyprenyl-6-methoxyphenol hydroxylase-like FAD-dependent oxidoreductase